MSYLTVTLGRGRTTWRRSLRLIASCCGEAGSGSERDKWSERRRERRASDLAQPYLQYWAGSDRGFGDGVLRYSLCGFDLTILEEMLIWINRNLKRSKALDEGRVQGCIVAPLDGVEVRSSYSRCCDSCLERRVTSRQGSMKVEQMPATRI